MRLPVLSSVGSPGDQSFWIALDVLELYPLLQATIPVSERGKKDKKEYETITEGENREEQRRKKVSESKLTWTTISLLEILKRIGLNSSTRVFKAEKYAS